jgi:predicted GH43/DUF377 family glycosyl hydrolase
MKVKRTGIVLKADCRRVLIRPFSVSDDNRIRCILDRIFMLSEEEVNTEVKKISAEFVDRHRDLLQFYNKRFEDMKIFLPSDKSCSKYRALLIGAYFSHEYSFESAALFNPSIVWAPDQSGLSHHSRRFILSLRATGEGHISSITFRTGLIDGHHRITIEQPSRFATSAELQSEWKKIQKNNFIREMEKSGLNDELGLKIIENLADTFTRSELDKKIQSILSEDPKKNKKYYSVAESLKTLALSSYQLTFKKGTDISERIIFPVTPSESNGIEDARFVQFENGEESAYYATYTAYNGKTILPKMLATKDFQTFKFRPLYGAAVKNKGLALFPKKINGKYVMLSREDNENNYILFSDDLYHWTDSIIIEKPLFPWEFIQLGNCGSPIETKAGWLVLSHGVGAMRKYTMGAFLLDLNDPTKLIGRTREPILSPDQTEREGYVPNVVYSCGSILHHDVLIIPYAMSDSAAAFATVNLDGLLAEMTDHRPV